jgi:hypothetical protein
MNYLVDTDWVIDYKGIDTPYGGPDFYDLAIVKSDSRETALAVYARNMGIHQVQELGLRLGLTNSSKDEWVQLWIEQYMQGTIAIKCIEFQDIPQF